MKTTITTIAIAISLVTGLYAAVAPVNPAIPYYSAEGDAIVRHNGARYNNRPLYAGGAGVFPLAGDRPFLRLLRGSYIHGCFMVALVRDGKGKWLNDCGDVTAKYRSGRMEWIVKDESFGETELDIQAVAVSEPMGMAIRLRGKGLRPGDQLIWAYGSGKDENKTYVFQHGYTSADISFQPDGCRGTEVRVDGEDFTLRLPANSLPDSRNSKPVASGRCSQVSHPVLADASAWQDPVALARSQAKELPVVCGTVAIQNGEEVFWAVKLTPEGEPAASGQSSSPADAFAAGIQRAETMSRQIVVETPDELLNAAVGVSCTAIDALWTSPMFMHGTVYWRSPYLGWRSMFGANAYGWHDRIKTEVELVAKAQITESKVTEPKADPNNLGWQAPDSCYFLGRGRIRSGKWLLHGIYEMQSQFFDQAIQDWRYTADPELEKVLRPAIELHLEYIKNCFDPDDDGVYSSYINTWPTDNQWYNGGGTAEETAYAYRGHAAALDMARRAKDEKAHQFHQAELEKIRQGFFRSLWVKDKGHSGAYRELLGYKRLHEDPWLYSIFVPIDAGLLDEEQAASSLHFTEYGLERVKSPLGGERLFNCNWIPIRGARYLHIGDVYHTALAYFQSGLADGGWNLFAGSFHQTMFNGIAPGDCAANSIDFADDTQMFGRTLVEGLFGYQPDYPNGRVRLAPQFPRQWDHASIRTPDMALRFTRTNLISRYEVELTRPAAMDLVLPAPTRQITKVTRNGKPVKWEPQPGFGISQIRVQVPSCGKALLEISCQDSLPFYPAVELAAITGEKITLEAPEARIVEFRDSQGAVTEAKIHDGKIIGKVSANTGHHLVLALAEVGSLRQWREFKLDITDPAAEARKQAKLLDHVPEGAQWECLDLAPVFNGDIRAIFQQKYLSPRPKTVAAGLRADGYRSWMMGVDRTKLPLIDLSKVPSLTKGDHQIVTPQGVPFRAWNEERNIAFTSQWDNWPKKVEIPVRKKGSALWFLVCGSSNPMQCLIANAVLRMKYADNVMETLELIPPLNYWTLCPIDGKDYKATPFCLPKKLPETVQLGQNCRAMLLNWRLREGVELESVTLETLSQEVVVGLMGVTIMNHNN